MAPKCKPDVAAARAQTERMLKEAEKAIGAMPSTHPRPLEGAKAKPFPKGPRSAEHCLPQLASARATYEAAGEASDALKQRDGYIAAAYRAGQALSCARVTQVGKKLGRMPAPKKPKKPKQVSK